MMRKCDYEPCGRSYQAKRPQSKFCSPNCRVKNSRTPPSVVPAASRRKTVAQGDNSSDHSADPSESGLVRATRRQLENAGVVIEESIEAQQALRIAEQMSGRETAGGMASLSKEFSRVKAEALRSAPPLTADPVDELGERRLAKLAQVV